MIDFECNHLVNGTITPTTFYELIEHKTILLCSVVRPVDEFSVAYVHYLNSITKKFSTVIDQLFIIDGYNENWIHPCFNSKFPHIKTITDSKLELLTHLAEEYHQSDNINKLNQFWSYQILIQNRNTQNFYHRPVEMDWNMFSTHPNVKQLIKEQGTSHLVKWMAKIIKNKEHEFYNPMYVHDHHRQYPAIPLELKRLGRYFNLWPNLELENLLKSMVDNQTK